MLSCLTKITFMMKSSKLQSSTKVLPVRLLQTSAALLHKGRHVCPIHTENATQSASALLICILVANSITGPVTPVHAMMVFTTKPSLCTATYHAVHAARV